MTREQRSLLDESADTFLDTTVMILADVARSRLGGPESDDGDVVERLVDGVIEPLREELRALVAAEVSQA